MAGIASSAYKTNVRTKTAVDQLAELLDALFPDPDLNIFTLRDFQNRYILTGLGDLASREIEQSQRINRRTRNFSRIGLCEFHVGLIYLFWGDNHGALQQFRLARRQWSFISKPKYAVCLAHFAEGAAQELAYHYEEALSCYGRAQQCLERKSPARFGFRLGNDPDSAAQAMRNYLQHRGRAVRETLWNTVRQTWQPQPDPAEYAPQFVWYQVLSEESRLFPQIKKGMWLLVNQAADRHKFRPGELLALRQERPIGSAVILQTVNEASPFPRICLAQAENCFSFTRDEEGRVTLTPRYRNVPVNAENILGIVAGFWRAANAPNTGRL
ncbi:MAG TPA: hypothetical protein ENK32_08065 [Anaerolineae bacterium]|nr:hypothetical protein [Anaerolineae bacterium]